jgi:hypothetical protein
MKTTLTDQLKCIAPELGNAALFYGMYSRLARKLSVSPQHVRQVAAGIHTSKRIAAAIRREVRRINALRAEKAA